MEQRDKNIFYIMLFFAMFSWGASWVNVKVLSSYIDEFDMIFIRFGITAITLLPVIMILKKSLKIDLKTFMLALFASIAFIAYMKYFFLGTKFGTAALGGALVTSMIPINTFVILAIFGSRDAKKKDYFALSLGAIGVLTMLDIWDSHLKDILVIQNLYFLFASILWPIFTIISSKSRKISPIVFSFYIYVITVVLDGIFFVDFHAIHYSGFDTIFWINMLVISIVASTFANTVYFLGIERLGAGNVSSFIFLVPFSAILLSAIFLHEHIGISIIIGTVMTLYAVKILNNIKFKSIKHRL
ncbi:DMT family transporter [Sulfurospirillum sp. 1612]|uniref:DMT family transporter n=1 Tax=Sulfurospirillum sp. 1612 TaxID=3094835 RepID=UPI002F91FAEC